MAKNALFAQQNKEVADKIIATVDNNIILKSELDARLVNMYYDGQIKKIDQETRCKVLEGLLVQKIMLAKAEIDSVNVEEKTVNNQMDRRFAMLLQQCCGGDASKVEKLYNKTIGDLKNEMRESIREQMVSQKMEGEISKDVKVTPKEVKKFFQEMPKDLKERNVKREFEVSQIVRFPAPNKSQKLIAKAKIDSLKKLLVEGGDFEEIAKKNSEDHVSGAQGGSLGWQQRGSLVPQFEATIFKLKPNELSEAVESEFGFHLIKLHERRGNEFLSSHILIKPNATELDLENETKFLDSLRNKIMLDSIKFEKAAKEYSHDKSTAPSGGVILSDNGSSKNLDDEIDSFVYLVVSEMEVGKISTPKPYRDNTGKMGVRILLLKSNIPPHDLNLKEDYQKVYNYTLMDKKNKAMNDWFIKTKEQLYINVDPEFKDCVFFQDVK